LSQHPDVVAASIEATRRFGVAPAHRAWSTAIIRTRAREQASGAQRRRDCRIGSGLTNVGTSSRSGTSDLIVPDEPATPTLVDGRGGGGARARVPPQRGATRPSWLRSAAHRRCLCLPTACCRLAALPPSTTHGS
jgi:hypothetical protein